MDRYIEFSQLMYKYIFENCFEELEDDEKIPQHKINDVILFF